MKYAIYSHYSIHLSSSVLLLVVQLSDQDYVILVEFTSLVYIELAQVIFTEL